MADVRPTTQEHVVLPGHVVDLSSAELRSTTGEHVDLRPRSFSVLRVLAENLGSLVTKDEIIAKVWDDAAVTEDSLTQCITEIRKVIGDDERRVLRTIPRRGYMLTSTEQPGSSARTYHQPTLAVLPFRSLSGNEETSLALGIASELLNELARNRDLRLIGRESSFAAADQTARAQELGEKLGARYLVEGTVKRAKNELMVDVQLVDAREEIIVWGDSFSAKAVDILHTQRLIANQIAANVRVSMHETEKYTILGRPPRDLDVYQLTLRAMSEHRFTPEATRASRQGVEEAIRRDPNFGLAWAQLAWVNMLDAWIQLTGEWHFSQLDEVIDQFSRAIELDPNLSAAYRGLGQALILKGDVAQGLTMSRRGFELAPSAPDSLLFYGIALFESGELAEATDKIEQALALHPRRPSYYSNFYAVILWANERFDEALTVLETVSGAEVYRALVLVGLGRIDEAKDQIAKYRARPSRPVLVTPHPPDLAKRFLDGLNAAGWQPPLEARQGVG